MEARLGQAAKTARTSRGQYVREAVQEKLSRESRRPLDHDPVAEMMKMNGPTADIEEIIAILDNRYGPLPE
jgi:hypothetical protein